MLTMTPWVRKLLIANIAMFFLAPLSPVELSFYPPAIFVRPWTLVSYMFLHAGFMHLLFNMIGLYFFGPRVEDRLGAKGFLWLYFLSGLGAALFHFLFAPESSVVGASGAVYGVLLAFAMYWPRVRIYLWAILPIEAWLLATLLVFGSLYAGVNPSGDSSTAHFAHLGGLAFGFVFIKWWEWRKGAAKRAFDKKLHPEASPTGLMGDRLAAARWKGIVLDSLHELNREEVVRLLAKVESEGAGNLRPSERQFLDRMSVD
jgi:membrane associated rhomboid family serine protease